MHYISHIFTYRVYYRCVWFWGHYRKRASLFGLWYQCGKAPWSSWPFSASFASTCWGPTFERPTGKATESQQDRSDTALKPRSQPSWKTQLWEIAWVTTVTNRDGTSFCVIHLWSRIFPSYVQTAARNWRIWHTVNIWADPHSPIGYTSLFPLWSFGGTKHQTADADATDASTNRHQRQAHHAHLCNMARRVQIRAFLRKNKGESCNFSCGSLTSWELE